MKAFWRIVGIGLLVAVLGAVALGSVISAQVDDTATKDKGELKVDSGGPWSAWKELLMEVTAEELGMSTRELWAEVKDGSTIAGLAEVQGVDQQGLFDATIVRLAEWLDAAVEKGAISQADADGMLVKMQGVGLGLLSKTWADAGEKDKGKPDVKGAWHELLIKVAAEELGMSANELYAELKAGATIAGLTDLRQP